MIESSHPGGGVDPNTNLVTRGVTVDAALATTTTEAQATFASVAPQAQQCFTDRLESTPGPGGENYQATDASPAGPTSSL